MQEIRLSKAFFDRRCCNAISLFNQFDRVFHADSITQRPVPAYVEGLGGFEVLECPVGRVGLVTTMCLLNIVESPLLSFSLKSLIRTPKPDTLMGWGKRLQWPIMHSSRLCEVEERAVLRCRKLAARQVVMQM